MNIFSDKECEFVSLSDTNSSSTNDDSSFDEYFDAKEHPEEPDIKIPIENVMYYPRSTDYIYHGKILSDGEGIFDGKMIFKTVAEWIVHFKIDQDAQQKIRDCM